MYLPLLIHRKLNSQMLITVKEQCGNNFEDYYAIFCDVIRDMIFLRKLYQQFSDNVKKAQVHIE